MASDLSTLLGSLTRSIRESIHVAVIAKVSAYDAATQTCTAAPLVRETRTIGRQRIDIEPLSIPGIPVVWPGGGGRSITMGLAADDLVLLVYRHQSHDQVDDGTTTTHTANSARRMNPSDTIAVPAFTTTGQGRADGQVTVTMPTGEALHVGSKTAALALAKSVETSQALEALKAVINTHTHVVAAFGVPCPPGVPQVAALPSIASDVIKVTS